MKKINKLILLSSLIFFAKQDITLSATLSPKDWTYNSNAVGSTLTYYGSKTVNFNAASSLTVHYDDGTEVVAYCIDPYANGVNKADNGTVVESTATSDYAYLWNTICGNTKDCPSTKTSELAAATRAYTALLGSPIDTDDPWNPTGKTISQRSSTKTDGKTYAELFAALDISNPSSYTGNKISGKTYYGTASTTKDLIDIINTANNPPAPAAGGSSSGNIDGVTIGTYPAQAVNVSTSLADKSKLDSLNSSPYCSCKESGSLYICSCKLEDSTCEADKTKTETIPINGVTTNKDSCTPTIYQVNGTYATQRFLGCAPDNTPATTGSITLQCDSTPGGTITPDPGDCEYYKDEYCQPGCNDDPDCKYDKCTSSEKAACDSYIDDLSDYDNYNASICDSDGEVVVDYTSFIGSLCTIDSSGNIDCGELDWEVVECCMFHNSSFSTGANSSYDTTDEVTELLLDDYISSYTGVIEEDKLKSFCPILCTLEYSWNLPGPTSNEGKPLGSNNELVYINAGTYFTINDNGDKINSVKSITCHLDLNGGYDNLVSYIYQLRLETMNAYNEYQRIQAENNPAITINTSYSCSSGWSKDGSECYKNATGNATDGYTCSAGTTLRGSKCYKAATASYSYEISKEYPQYIYDDYEFKTTTPKKYSAEDGSFASPNAARTAAKSQINTNISNNASKLEEAEKTLDGSYATKITTAISFYEGCANQMNLNIEKAEDIYDDYSVSFSYWDSEMDYYDDPTLVKQEKQYSTSNGSATNGSSESGVVIDTSKYTNICKISGSDAVCEATKKDNDAFNAKLAESVVTIKTPYKFDNYYCVHADGNEVNKVTASSESSEGASCDSGEGITIKGFPVSTQDTQGEYAYTYKYKLPPNGDEYSDTCYYNVNNSDDGTPDDPGDPDPDCPSCNIVCEGGACSGSSKECDTNCQTRCVNDGCIFEKRVGFMGIYKTITLNNTFALLENAGNILAMSSTKNADNVLTSTTSGNFSNWHTGKGDATQLNIITSTSNVNGTSGNGEGEAIYNDDPEYAIKLDRETIMEIQEYNDTHPGYSNMEGNYNIVNSTLGNYFTFNSNFVGTYLCNSTNLQGTNISCGSHDFIQYTSGASEFVGPAWK